MNHSKLPLGTLLEEAFPSSTPSLRLESRIISGVRVRRPRRKLRLAFGAVGGVFALAGLVFLTPRAVAYAEFQRIEAAADSLPQWRLTTYTPDLNGNLVNSGETWCRNGQVRDEREFGQVVLLRSVNSVVEYHKGADHAVRSPSSDTSGQVKKLSGFIQELQHTTNLLGLSVERETTVEGRHATRVSALSKNEPVRISIYADSQTDVPFLGLVEAKSEHGWRIERKIVIDATPFDVSGISFGLPHGVRIIDRSAMQAEWREKLGKPIATYPATSKWSALEIRDVWVNRDGIVFVMYTNGRSPRPVDTTGWKSRTSPDGTKILESPHRVPAMPNTQELITIEDDLGTNYSQLNGFQGFETTLDGTWSRGLTWAEGDANVAVYAPNSRPLKLAHRLKLTFGFSQYLVPKGFKPHDKYVYLTDMERVQTTTAVHVQAVKAHPRQLPEWADFIGISLEPLALDAEVARVRSIAAISTGDGKTAEQYARDYLQLTQMEATQSGNSYVMSDRYDLLGQALNAEGKSDEARKAWEQALDDAQSRDHDRIVKEMNTLRDIPR